jgi:predicted Zn-dependent protease
MRNLIVVAVLALAGCANQSQVGSVWIPDQGALTVHSKTGIWLAKDGKRKFIPPETINNLDTAWWRIHAESKMTARIVVVDNEEPIAVAFRYKGEDYVGFSTGFLDRFGSDSDVIATTLGHELAHIALGHTDPERAQKGAAGRQAAQAVGIMVGMIAGPLGGLAVEAGATGYVNSFSRDDEREADAKGLEWATGAGYSACGHARMVQELQGAGIVGNSFLSTHPSYGERSDLANQIAVKATGKGCPQ